MERENKNESHLALKDRCSECGGENLVRDYETGEIICRDCGLVVKGPAIDTSPEWRAFTDEEIKSRSRVGMPTSYAVHDKGLSTNISQIDRDSSGRRLPLSTKLQMWRLRRWQIRSRAHASIDRNLAQAMTELDRMADKLSIPESVKEKAAVIYRKALDKGLVRGRSIAGVVAASLYAACRVTGTPRNLREISEKSLVTRKEVSRDYRLILHALDMHMPISDPKTYLTKIAEKARLNSQIQRSALKILGEAREKKLATGKDPTGLAAAALYIASKQSGEKITQKDIAEAAEVTEVTVRNRYRTLSKQLNLEFD